MEVSELVSRTKQCSFHDIHLKLPLNQDPQSNLDSTLIGKLISTKPLGLNIVKAVVTNGWQPVYPLEVRKLEYNIFPFRFQHEADSQQAFQRQPQSIRGGHLILKKWCPNPSWQEIDFTTSSFQIPIHGLPTLQHSKDNLRQIGIKIRKVLEIDFTGDGGEYQRRFTRIKVDIDITQPLLPSFFLPRANLNDLLVSIKYEKLSYFCYTCGIIGHDEKECIKEFYQLQNPFGSMFYAARSWLRLENDHIPIGVYNKADRPTIFHLFSIG